MIPEDFAPGSRVKEQTGADIAAVRSTLASQGIDSAFAREMLCVYAFARTADTKRDAGSRVLDDVDRLARKYAEAGNVNFVSASHYLSALLENPTPAIERLLAE